VDSPSCGCSARLAGVPRGASWALQWRMPSPYNLGSLLTSLNIAPVASSSFDSDRPTPYGRNLSHRNGVMRRTNFLGSQDVGFADKALVFQKTLAESINALTWDEPAGCFVPLISLKGALQLQATACAQQCAGTRSLRLL